VTGDINYTPRCRVGGYVIPLKKTPGRLGWPRHV